MLLTAFFGHLQNQTPPPLREHLPIHVAGINPRSVQGPAGRISDGLIGHPMFTMLGVDEVVRPSPPGPARAGRDAEEVAISGVLMCAIYEDVEVARRQLTFSVAQYAASRVMDLLFQLQDWCDA